MDPFSDITLDEIICGYTPDDEVDGATPCGYTPEDEDEDQDDADEA